MGDLSDFIYFDEEPRTTTTEKYKWIKTSTNQRPPDGHWVVVIRPIFCLFRMLVGAYCAKKDCIVMDGSTEPMDTSSHFMLIDENGEDFCRINFDYLDKA